MSRHTKTFIFCILLLTALFSCNKQHENVSIKGEIENLEYPYILASYIAADTLAIDTIPVNEKGKFNYRSTIDSLTVLTFYFNEYKSSAVVFADQGEKLSMKGDAKFPDLIKINGNEINDDLTAFKIQNEDLLKQRGQLLVNIHNENGVSPDETILSRTEEIAQLNSLNHELLQIAEDHIKNNPTKASSVILANDFFVDSENPKALERVLGYLQGDASKSRMTTQLKMHSEKINRSAEGAQMPYFQLTDNKDKNINSNDLRGKFIVLSFLSSAGQPSRDNVAALKSSYKNLNKDSVNFVSIYIDTDVYPIKYLENDSISWTVVPEKKSWASDIVESFNIQMVPYNILIAPDGTIKDRNIPAQQIESTIKNSTSV